ncbi:MAG: P1 family peptidase, partial [Parvularculales bacterium]
MQPGPHNLITDVDGISVGNAEDSHVATGVTVILPEGRAVAAVDSRGGGPGTRETDALDPVCLVDEIDGIVLSGGSSYGLEAASTVATRLGALGRGFAMRSEGPVSPVVPAAILYDLANGGDKQWDAAPPYGRLGDEALEAAIKAEQAGDKMFTLGNAGAGYGASAGNLKGGLGSTSFVCGDGLQIGALVATNPFGAVVMPNTTTLWAAPWEIGDE